jgi:hypothetical protein
VEGLMSNLIAGAIGGVIAVFLIAPARERQRIWLLSKHLELRRLKDDDPRHYRVWVKNSGTETISDAIGYLTLEHEPTDIVTVSDIPTFNGLGHRAMVVDGRLCWAIGGNAHKIDIYPGESQLLNFAKIESRKAKDGAQMSAIVVPSEEGYGERGDGSQKKDKHARVCLTPKSYKGILRIVGKNILSRTFSVQIDVAGDAFSNIQDPLPHSFIAKWPFWLFNEAKWPFWWLFKKAKPLEQ